MAIVFALNHFGATFQGKLTNFLKEADISFALISDQFIVFYKPDGTRFEKQATLDVDPVNPSQIITLTNIVGDGIEDTITVTIPNTALLKTGELMSISGTTNFNVSNKKITIVDGTKFTYKLGTTGSVAAEGTGTVTTEGEKLVTYQNTTPDPVSILDVRGKWEYAIRAVLTSSDDFETRDRSVFWVE